MALLPPILWVMLFSDYLHWDVMVGCCQKMWH